jgi:histidinol-phosphatase (PHP family)
MSLENIEKVSVHGGHSASYCFHAMDALEDIVKEYIRQGFKWFGITEHMPPLSNEWIYSFERPYGWNAERMKKSFIRYAEQVRLLQKKYQDQIEIFLAFETEWYDGCEKSIDYWINEIEPDYIVGSVHHMATIEMDTSRKMYMACVKAFGSIEVLYEAYFDAQLDLMKCFRPSVIGHMDLVRIFDSDYKERIKTPSIWERILRNLEYVKQYDLILDFNLRALTKGQAEPYISNDILETAIEMGISVVPGDDSHGINLVGNHWESGIDILKLKGADLNWKKPALIG